MLRFASGVGPDGDTFGGSALGMRLLQACVQECHEITFAGFNARPCGRTLVEFILEVVFVALAS